MTVSRLLVAGIGNIFFGDDAFGVEVVRRLAQRPLREGMQVRDFGIRGFDLACALGDGFAGAILVDTTQRGGTPGSLYVIEPDLPGEIVPTETLDAHGLHPVKVLQLARTLGQVCPWLRLVGCEPLTFGSDDDPAMGLSEPVEKAIDEAVRLVEALAGQFLDSPMPG